MARGRHVVAFAVAVLIVVAGCTAPAVDPGDRASPDDSTPGPGGDATTDADESTDSGLPDYVRVVDGTLPVDANTTYERVEALLGTEYGGTRVFVQDLTMYKSADLAGVPFFHAFGVSNPSLDASQPAGLTTLDATVYVSPANAEPGRVEQVLAHEFVHVAQVRENMVPWFGALTLGRMSLDERFARRALVEGGAVFVTDAYSRDHLPSVDLQSAHVAAQYENGTSGNRVVYSQYHFGFQYVNATIDNPAALPEVYDDASETTENLLHPGERDDPVPLDVTVETTSGAGAAEPGEDGAGEDGAADDGDADDQNTGDPIERVRSPTGRAGELFVRIALRDTAGRDAAVEAADGWGNDRVLAFDTEPNRSVAWVTRWDTPADADEFANASRTLSNASTGFSYRTTRVSEDTVVVFAGTESFVERAEASGNVTVSA